MLTLAPPQVEVMGSLVQPKKLTIRASDGRKYIILCKPKDDLRKDAGMCEIATIINKILKKNSEANKRQLRIRSYVSCCCCALYEVFVTLENTRTDVLLCNCFLFRF